MKAKTFFLQLRRSAPASLYLTISLMALGACRLSAATDTNDYTEKLGRRRYFQQPLVWLGEKAPSQEESKEMWEAFGGDEMKVPEEALPLLEGFLQAHTNSPWGPSLRLHLGEYYNRSGYFSLALDEWEKVWNSTKAMKDGKGAEVADRALVDRLQLLASLGRAGTMKELFEETKQPPIFEIAHYKHLQRAYSHMVSHPENSYRCGTLALDAVTKALFGTNNFWGLEQQKSPESGFSMAELVRLSESNHLGLVAVERPSGTELVSPSVVHWKENHYAAIVEQKNDKYLVEDPTFQMKRWLTADAINHEASGQFLVPAEKRPASWRKLDDNESGQIFGKGNPWDTFMPNPGPPCNSCPCPDGSSGTGPNGGAPGSPNGPHSGCDTCLSAGTGPGSPGMPVWEVTEPDENLWLEDEPLAYQTATGGRFSFKMYYFAGQSFNINPIGVFLVLDVEFHL